MKYFSDFYFHSFFKAANITKNRQSKGNKNANSYLPRPMASMLMLAKSRVSANKPVVVKIHLYTKTYTDTCSFDFSVMFTLLLKDFNAMSVFLCAP